LEEITISQDLYDGQLEVPEMEFGF
jgi:hypothetical protein